MNKPIFKELLNIQYNPCTCKYPNWNKTIARNKYYDIFECRDCHKHYFKHNNYKYNNHKQKYEHNINKKDGYFKKPRIFKITLKDNILYFNHIDKKREYRGQAKFDLNDNQSYVRKNNYGSWRSLSSLTYYFRDYSFRKRTYNSIPINDWFFLGDKQLFLHIKDIILSKFDIHYHTGYRYRQKRPQSVATMLPYIRNLWYHKEWNDAGIRCNHMIGIGVKSLNKKSRKLLIEKDVSLSKSMENIIIKDRGWMENLIVLLENERIPNHKGIGYNRKNLWQKIISSNCDIFYELEKDYNHKVKDTIRYIYNYIIPYEGIDLDESLRLLRDYARMHKQMNVKEYKKYPKYLKSNHDIIQTEFNNYKKEHDVEIFKNMMDENLELMKKEFCVVVPKLPDDLKEEGKCLSHCVGCYIDRIIQGETKILFLRKQKEVPMVTLELRDEVIIQAKGYANRNITKDERNMIEKYAKEKQLVVRV